jgi:hypothetical protein
MQTALTNDFTCWGMISVRDCARAVLAAATKLENTEVCPTLADAYNGLRSSRSMASLKIECDPESVINKNSCLHR